MPKIILHIDLDAFFASAEEREHPEYKGKPVIVGADPKGGEGRGVISTCNYEARKYGLHSAMPISIAYKKCPNGSYLPVNFKLYTETSARIMQILSKHAEKIEQVSIDEAYLDVTKLGSYEKAKELAIKIKKEILEKEKLTSSIGIGPNKLISKVGSDYQKPDGLTIVTPEQVLDFLEPQKVGVLRGVGPKTRLILNKYGIKTVEDLRKFTREQLTTMLGSFGLSLYEQSRGVYDEELVSEWTTKSMGRNHTFEQNTKDKQEIFKVLEAMIDDVWKQLQSENMKFKTITVRIRYEDFQTHTKQKSLIDYSTSIEAIRNTAKDLLHNFLKDPRKVRLIGVSLHQLA